MLIQNNKILGNHLYQYSYNNSINYVDESGHKGNFLSGLLNKAKKQQKKQ